MEQFLHTIIREAGRIGLIYYDKEFDVQTKSSPQDLLTEADTAINDYLSSIIRSTFPEHNLMTEEAPFIDVGGQYEWVIDPIDGTYNFAHGISSWAVMIALLYKGSVQYSAVYFPVSDRLFYANSDGAFLNGKKIQVDCSKTQLSEATTQTYYAKPFGNYGTEYERYQKAKVRFVEEVYTKDRHLGCSASTVFLLSGFTDVLFGNCGLDWDYLPPFYILEKGGAIITDSYGNPWQRGRQDYVIAANQTLHNQMMNFFD